MKGIVVIALRATIVDNFGYEAWQKSLERAGLSPHSYFRASVDVPDELVIKVIQAVCEELNITLAQAGEAFGYHWMNKITPRVYTVFFYKVTSSRQMFLKLGKIHDTVTRTIENARPPRFDYRWKNKDTLIMTYISERGLIDIALGIAKGVGTYFKEKLSVRKLSNTEIEVIFPPEKETA